MGHFGTPYKSATFSVFLLLYADNQIIENYALIEVENTMVGTLLALMETVSVAVGYCGDAVVPPTANGWLFTFVKVWLSLKSLLHSRTMLRKTQHDTHAYIHLHICISAHQ